MIEVLMKIKEMIKESNQKLKTNNNVIGILAENTVIENSADSSIELKETTTKAELTINKQNLSTMSTNNEVVLGVKLITDGVKYDLYKNPKIRIQLHTT